MPQNNSVVFIPVATISIVTFIGSIIFFLLLRNTSALSFMSESNIIMYSCALLIFAGMFFLSLVILYRIPYAAAGFDRLIRNKLHRSTTIFLFFCCFLFFVILLLHRRFVAEFSEFAISFSSKSIHDFSIVTGILIYLVIGTIALLIVFIKKEIPSWILILCYVISAVLCFMATLTIDISAADRHHGVAYLESIYNVYYGAPYNEFTTGVYGHYGLFYGIALRLLDGGNIMLSCMIASIAALVSLCCSYVLHITVKTSWLRLLGTFACGFTVLTMRTTNYYQVQPHRILFPALILVVLVWQAQKNSWNVRNRVIDYVFVVLSILWNTETGLFSMIAVTAALIVHDLTEESWRSKKQFKRYLIYLSSCLCSLLVAIGVVIIYNYFCHWNDFNIRMFFAPLFVPTYMDGTLRYDMFIRNSAWIYVLLLFAGILMVSLRHTSLFVPQEKYHAVWSKHYAPVLTALAFFGLMNFSYYANRAAYYNLDITMQLSALGICIIADKNIPFLRRLFHKEGGSLVFVGRCTAGALCTVIIAVLGVQSICFSPYLLKTKCEKGQYSPKAIQKICNALQQNVPKDTYAVGYGITIYYQIMKWDPQAHYTDFSDITIYGGQTLERIVDDVVQRDSFLITGDNEGLLALILEKKPEFEMVWSYDDSITSLQYWIDLEQ